MGKRKRKRFLPIAGIEPGTLGLGAEDLTTELWCYYAYVLHKLAIYSYIQGSTTVISPQQKQL